MGTLGPLTATQSKMAIGRLQGTGAEPSSLFDRHLFREEAVTGGPLATASKVLLQDGPAYLPCRDGGR